MLNSVEDFHL